MKKDALTLMDVLLAMIIIGTIFSMSIPVLKFHSMDKEIVSKFQKFSNTLEKAVELWKTDRNCQLKFSECISARTPILTNNPNLQPLNFNEIKQYLKIVNEVDKGPSTAFWMPEETLDYYGTKKSEFDFKTNTERSTYLTLDGAVFSVFPDNRGFWIVVDVNGRRLPNRIGKDTFHMTIGYTNNDINYNAKFKTLDGICGHGYWGEVQCNPNNLKPNVGNGASPTAYLVINQKIPNFKSLSQTVSNFKP